jgi:hypothetical protein
MFEVPKDNAESAIDNWVQNHTEWTVEPQEHSMVETNTEPDGSGTDYIIGIYSFYQDTPATDLLDDLESRLSSMQGGLWYRVGYHVCDHDEDYPGDCSWEEVRENGQIPSDFPTFR